MTTALPGCPLSAPAVCGFPAFLAPNHTQRVVDDVDPAVTFNGPWKSLGQSPWEHNGTLHGSGPGGTGTFNFSGNSVSLFGTVPLAGGRYCNVSYAIDSSPATLSATPVVNNTNITVFGALLYTSPALPDGDHVLTFTVVACNPPNPTNPTAFFVDYLIYQPSTSVASNISASDPAASSTIFPTAFSTATPSASASTGQNNTVIYALAAVLGVVVLLAIFVIVWLLLGRRQIEHTLKLMAGKLDTDEPSNRQLDQQLPVPYTVPHGERHISCAYVAAPGSLPGVLSHAAMSELPEAAARFTLQPTFAMTGTTPPFAIADRNSPPIKPIQFSLAYKSIQPPSSRSTETKLPLRNSQLAAVTSSASPQQTESLLAGRDQPPLYVFENPTHGH